MRLWVGSISNLASIFLTAAYVGKTLLRRYKAAVADRNLQKEAFRGFTTSLEDDFPISQWEKMCCDWDADGFPKTSPNPFYATDTSKRPCWRCIHLMLTDWHFLRYLGR